MSTEQPSMPAPRALDLAGLTGLYADAITAAVQEWEPRYWPMFHDGDRDRATRNGERYKLSWWAAAAAHSAVHQGDESGRTALVHGAMCLAYQNALAALDEAPSQGMLDLGLSTEAVS